MLARMLENVSRFARARFPRSFGLFGRASRVADFHGFMHGGHVELPSLWVVGGFLEGHRNLADGTVERQGKCIDGPARKPQVPCGGIRRFSEGAPRRSCLEVSTRSTRLERNGVGIPKTCHLAPAFRLDHDASSPRSSRAVATWALVGRAFPSRSARVHATRRTRSRPRIVRRPRSTARTRIASSARSNGIS